MNIRNCLGYVGRWHLLLSEIWTSWTVSNLAFGSSISVSTGRDYGFTVSLVYML